MEEILHEIISILLKTHDPTNHALEEAPRIQEDKNLCSHLLVNTMEGT